MRLRRSTLTLASLALSLVAAQAAAAQPSGGAQPAAKPAAPKVTGSMRATWVHERGGVTPGEGFRREVAIRWKPVSVARTAAQAYSWIQGRQTRYTSYAIEFDWGYVIRATVAIDKFTETLRQTCRDGSFAQLTTTIASVRSPRVLLKTSDTRLDLAGRRGTLDIRLPNDHVATGEQLPNTFVASGTARLAYAGTMCTEGGTAAPPDPSQLLEEQELGPLLGSEALNGIVQDNGDLPVAVGRDGSLAVTAKRDHAVAGLEEGVRIAGTFEADLRITGPAADRSARCTLPSLAQMRTARSAASAQRLLRRHGFPRAPLGRPRSRRASERGAVFGLNAPANAQAPCGAILGTARRPVLVPLRP